MSVGLNAVPTWLKPYRILSNGEKFRASLARQIGHGATIDNFTCITNRNVAASTATSLARLIRRFGSSAGVSEAGGGKGVGGGFRRVVLASSYPDIIEYLSPDWIIYTNSRRLVLNLSPSYGPAITVDWSVSHEAAQKVADQLLAASSQDSRDELMSTTVKQNEFTQKVFVTLFGSWSRSMAAPVPTQSFAAFVSASLLSVAVSPPFATRLWSLQLSSISCIFSLSLLSLSVYRIFSLSLPSLCLASYPWPGLWL